MKSQTHMHEYAATRLDGSLSLGKRAQVRFKRLILGRLLLLAMLKALKFVKTPISIHLILRLAELVKNSSLRVSIDS